MQIENLTDEQFFLELVDIAPLHTRELVRRWTNSPWASAFPDELLWLTEAIELIEAPVKEFARTHKYYNPSGFVGFTDEDFNEDDRPKLRDAGGEGTK